MEFNVGMDGDIVVIEIQGDVVASSIDEMKAQVAKLMEKNFKYFLLDLNKVNFMDSSGLGACMALNKMLLDKKGVLVLCKPTDSVAKVFKVTRAELKLSIAPTRPDGVKLAYAKISESRSK